MNLSILYLDLSRIKLISWSVKLQEFKRVFPFVAAPIPTIGPFFLTKSLIFLIVKLTFCLNKLNSLSDIFED